MKTVDLHAHTTTSDGSMTPTELIQYAKEKGLTAIAVTDHDTVGGLEEAMAAGEALGIQVILLNNVVTCYIIRPRCWAIVAYVQASPPSICVHWF